MSATKWRKVKMWDDIETLRSLSHTLMLCTVACGVLAAAITGGRFYIDRRVSRLSSISQNEREGTLKSQIASLTEDLASTKRQETGLETKAQDAERGISDTWDFGGAHRENLGAGRISATRGIEMAVFEQLQALEAAKNWSALRDLSESQITKTPRWLTPYLCSGIANAHLHELDKAKDRLGYVVKTAGDDPHYAAARRLLSALEAGDVPP